MTLDDLRDLVDSGEGDKRFAANSFAPMARAWGEDNRTSALRAVGHGSARRIECRAPGADVNPYLAISTLIAAGLHGIDAGVALPPRDAHDVLAGSALARGAFGDDVVDQYLNAARVELAAFDAAVTDWERVRGFERL